VRIAPQFAAAQGALARVRVASAEYYHELPRQALVTARAAATRALEIDPTVSEAQSVIGDVLRMLEADWVGAETAYVRALELNASNEAALRSYGLMLALQSRHGEAVACVEHARELDPLCLATRTTSAWTRHLAQDYDAAIAQCRHTVEMDPQFVPARRVLAAALLQAGEATAAIAELEQVLAGAEGDSDPVLLSWLAHLRAVTGARGPALALIARVRALGATRYVPPFHLALAHTGLGDHEAAFAALDQAWLDRDPALGTLDVEPRFRPLRDEPRYAELLERINVGGVGRGGVSAAAR
jgi:tetratricopeptide (TPR) repeat protein